MTRYELRQSANGNWINVIRKSDNYYVLSLRNSPETFKRALAARDRLNAGFSIA